MYYIINAKTLEHTLVVNVLDVLIKMIIKVIFIKVGHLIKMVFQLIAECLINGT